PLRLLVAASGRAAALAKTRRTKISARPSSAPGSSEASASGRKVDESFRAVRAEPVIAVRGAPVRKHDELPRAPSRLDVEPLLDVDVAQQDAIDAGGHV